MSTSASSGRTCTECGAPARYRYANIPRGYRTDGDSIWCAEHAAETAADGGSIARIPTGTPTVWVVEGDDHEARVVEASDAQEAVALVADGFSEQYEEPYDRDLCTIVGGFVGDINDLDELEFVPTEHADNESRALEALERC